MILVFILATNPTATQAMAKATLTGGQKPLVTDAETAEGGSSSKS
jgi:hypothetical protein